jgi:hypothetical protein
LIQRRYLPRYEDTGVVEWSRFDIQKMSAHPESVIEFGDQTHEALSAVNLSHKGVHVVYSKV